MLQVEEVTKKFGGLEAVKNVSFKINRGEILGLIGPNGAGKTTLINLISGVYRPDKGRILFKGEDITLMKPHEICKKGISRTLQIPHAFPELTVIENIAIPLLFSQKNLKRDEIRGRIISTLKRIDFPKSKYDEVVANLNTLELKYLQLAKAVVTQPELLLLDEVTTGLNPVESKRACEVIKELQSAGITILIVEHVMRIIVSVCDRIIALCEGRIVAEGRPEEVMKDTKVISSYLGKID